MTEAEGPGLLPFSIQLVSAFCVEAQGKRRIKADEDQAEPDYSVKLARTELNSSGTDFSCRLTLDTTLPVGALIAECHVIVQGDFRSADTIGQELLDRFMIYTPTLLLWPYARAYVGDLGRMLALPLLPIPTLDAMPSLAEEERGDAPAASTE